MNSSLPRILAIDDTPANLLTLGAALAGEFELQFATSGAEGLALAEAHPPELILLDVMMPEMDGYEVCRRLKRHPALALVPVVFITALNDIGSEIHGLELGAADYISKPINVKIARQRLRNLVEREQLRHEVERQRTELAAQVHTLLKLSTAVEQSPASVIIANIDAAIEYVNPHFSKTTGFTPEEIIGENPRIFHSGSTDPATYRQLWDTLTAGRVWKGELRNRRKNGELYWEFVQIAPIRDPSGQITHYVCIKSDISERKKYEEELAHYREHLEVLVHERTADLLQAKEAAEAANRAKSAFLTTMSHELRTPLNGIMGFNAIARRRFPEPQLDDLLAKVDGAAHHLLAIIDDLLDISRIEAAQLELADTEFEPGPTLEAAGQLIAPLATEKGLAFACHVAPELAGLTVHGDAQRLKQIVGNLLSNAVKFTAKGEVALEAKRVDAAPGRLCLRVAVRDTGIGIPPEDRQRIFEAFEQADSSLTRRFGGAGLGLSICRRLVEMMGGEIGVDSAPGQGSTFWFTVVLGLAGADSDLPTVDGLAEAEMLFRARHGGARVLLAEDDPINQEITVELLTDLGLVVDVADNGLEAVRLAQTAPYDVILMDMQMPLLGGIEATRLIRRIETCESVPIVALTANAFPEDRRQCRDAGMDDFIAKPFAPATLLATLQQRLAARG